MIMIFSSEDKLNMSAKYISPLGKLLRKIRIDSEISLSDMADNIGITKSYLSASELGKKDLSDRVFGLILEKYGDTCNKTKELKNARLISHLERVHRETSLIDDDQMDKIKTALQG